MCTSISGAVSMAQASPSATEVCGDPAALSTTGIGRVGGLVQPPQQLALVVGLAHLDRQPELLPALTHSATSSSWVVEP